MKVDKFNISKLEYYLIILTQIYLVWKTKKEVSRLG